MSENRQKYASSPLYGLKHARGGVRQVDERTRATNSSQGRPLVPLQIMLSAVLPLLFIAALILGYREIHWAFLALSLLSVLLMWGMQAFVPQARRTMTLLYTAMMLVSLAAALWFTQPMLQNNPDNVASTNDDLQTLFSNNVTASDVENYAALNGVQSVQAGSPTPDTRSEVQARLELYMNSWMSLDYDAMISCCTPAWVNAQADPRHEIFKIRGTSIPINYEIGTISGSDANDSRTVSMVATIDKGTGKEPKDYRYDVLMLRVNGVWYIDPASLSSSTEIKDLSTPTPTITIMPTYSPDPDRILYYNPDGGSFYHASDQCSKVSNKYLPLKGSFKYSQLNEEQFKNLKPCDKCNPPGRT